MMPHAYTGIENHFTQDTAGSERYESMSRIYYRGAKAAIVCYGEKCMIVLYKGMALLRVVVVA